MPSSNTVSNRPIIKEERRRAMAAVQQETTYKRELVAGDLISIHSAILEMRDKVIRFYHEMRNAERNDIAATTILTALHFDSDRRKSCPFPTDIVERGRRLISGRR